MKKVDLEPQLSNQPVIILFTADQIELFATGSQANNYIRKSFDVLNIVDKTVRLLSEQAISARQPGQKKNRKNLKHRGNVLLF